MNHLLEKLGELRALDAGRALFGAHEHTYRLAASLAEDELASLEKQYGIELPQQYR